MIMKLKHIYINHIGKSDENGRIFDLEKNWHSKPTSLSQG